MWWKISLQPNFCNFFKKNKNPDEPSLSLRPSTFQETQMVQASYGKEVETLRQNLLAQAQKLEAAQQRVTELETLLSKKEHLIVEQKKFLEDVKGQAK